MGKTISAAFFAMVAISAISQEATSYDAATYGPRVIVQSEMQNMIDSWFKGAETNGMVCAISFAPSFEKESPVFYVNFINTTTNFARGFLQIPIQNRASIKLFDSHGSIVAKTKEGEKFGIWTDSQMQDWFDSNREKPAPPGYTGSKSERDRKGISIFLFPSEYTQVTDGLSLPQLFQIKTTGEYTFHFQMKVAQTKVDEAKNITLNLFWLPEVIAKVQIRPENIGQTNSISGGQ
jgi:hypothetical protein